MLANYGRRTSSAAGQGRTKNGINNMVCRRNGRLEVVDKGNLEILELFGKSLDRYEHFVAAAEREARGRARAKRMSRFGESASA